jgi:hypothetical protein
VQAWKNDSFYKGERNADEGLQWNGVDTFSRLHKGSNANGGRPVDGRPKRNQNGVEPSTSRFETTQSFAADLCEASIAQIPARVVRWVRFSLLL